MAHSSWKGCPQESTRSSSVAAATIRPVLRSRCRKARRGRSCFGSRSRWLAGSRQTRAASCISRPAEGSGRAGRPAFLTVHSRGRSALGPGFGSICPHRHPCPQCRKESRCRRRGRRRHPQAASPSSRRELLHGPRRPRTYMAYLECLTTYRSLTESLNNSVVHIGSADPGSVPHLGRRHRV